MRDSLGSNYRGSCDEVLLSSTCPFKIEMPEPALGWPLQGLTVSPLRLSQEARQKSDSSDMFSEREDDESPLSRPGWPLLRIAAASAETMSTTPMREFKSRENMSVVQWVMMDLPSRRFLSANSQPQEGDENCLTVAPTQLSDELEILVAENSAGCRLFSYAEISSATCHFSAENLIGEGGCSSVYRGCLEGGESVAVKVLKSYKEVWDDFLLETKFVSSIQHKHITSLVGVCVEDGNLILVYDLFPRGSLEGNLYDCSDGCILPWEVRFNVAVAVAEALTYLHNNCPQPIIHRDVKSSNILLSDELQPQLSDFGLATWGPTDSGYVISSDVVGTFGYIAPEYFMHGMVSDKIDVYAFGVILLELLSGRKPVHAEASKGQESLVKWARNLLDVMDLKALLDPKLNGDYDVAQMRRMVMAAGLCINQSPRLRPKASQVLKLLTGETDANECFNLHAVKSRETCCRDEDDDLFPEVGRHSVSAMSDTNDGSISRSSSTNTASSAEKPHRYTLKDYLSTPDHYCLSEISFINM
ncbi:protein kinase STUNTED-like [Pyrus x bretschneideri]|uniref:protein kinase STUNTED-like n=1 Tax=Pyrus x bretschneideri TaxID=225117 RepID=UPI00202E328B|nr:protein kinase STUNTED-like [Pyrus x bretschneideri]